MANNVDGAYLASTAMLTKRYIARPFAWDDAIDQAGSVYTPDGGVLKAKTFAEGQRFADELNALLDQLEEKSKPVLDDHFTTTSLS